MEKITKDLLNNEEFIRAIREISYPQAKIYEVKPGKIIDYGITHETLLREKLVIALASNPKFRDYKWDDIKQAPITSAELIIREAEAILKELNTAINKKE